ncbi:B-box zinc finger protein 20-like [Primulina eburnea]|uniref:B-box zinc finger protein 20-like n=1 Tax=Primulina eburnea TaxID=1245227 RepID=UPI003C6CB49F
MKIRCDECGKEAYAFCTADEAALCQNCDDRIHNANKIARKHPRFSLQHPLCKESPSCDVCQERKALLFCQEDRALLCKECDVPVHRANEHTKKHNRFLLTGVKISPAADSEHQATTSPVKLRSESDTKNSATMDTSFQSNSVSNNSEQTSNFYGYDNESSQLVGQQGSASTSSISEYFMEGLPGWHVEDLLDPSPFRFL